MGPGDWSRRSKMKDERWKKMTTDVFSPAGWSDKTSSPERFFANKSISIFFRPHSKKSPFFEGFMWLVKIFYSFCYYITAPFQFCVHWRMDENNVVIPIWFQRPSGRVSATSVCRHEWDQTPWSIIHTSLHRNSSKEGLHFTRLLCVHFHKSHSSRVVLVMRGNNMR